TLHVVGDDDHLRRLQSLPKDLAAFCLEIGVADGHHLVDQIVIKIERHAHTEAEPRAHARRGGVDGLVEVTADLRELFDVADLLPHPRLAYALNPTDELDVVAPAQVLLQAAGQPDGPREPRLRDDFALIGKIDCAQQPHQRGLPGAVATDHRDIDAFGNLERQISKDHLAPAKRQVGLCNHIENDHWETLARYLNL